jgi:hypothetical protein
MRAALTCLRLGCHRAYERQYFDPFSTRLQRRRKTLQPDSSLLPARLESRVFGNSPNRRGQAGKLPITPFQQADRGYKLRMVWQIGLSYENEANDGQAQCERKSISEALNLNRLLTLPTKHDAHLRHHQTGNDGADHQADAVKL